MNRQKTPMNAVWFAVVASIPIVLSTASERAKSPPTAAAQEAADVWIVSTRRLPPGTCGQDGEPDYWRMGADGNWTASDESALWNAAPRPVPLIVFIHGNRWDADRAAVEGLGFWEQLRDLAPKARFRLVIWSWPADRIARRNRPDLIAKHYRSREEAVYLAQFLNRFAPEVPVSLIGYSYGAQTIIGALRLLAGDSFDGVRLERREPPRQAPLTAVLVAGAVESQALAEAAPHLSPLGQVSRILVIRNQCDPYLRFYPLLYKRGGPPAIGLIGPSCLDPESPDSRKIEVLDVTWEVGKRHDWECYRQAPSFTNRLPEYTFLRSASE